MISKKSQLFFLISIPIFIIHGLEEYFAGFANVDPVFKTVFGFLGLPVSNLSFFIFQIVFWIILISVYLSLRKGHQLMPLMVLLGLVFVFEIHHIFRAIAIQSYYPGLVTSFFFPVVGFLFWRELFKNFH